MNYIFHKGSALSRRVVLALLDTCCFAAAAAVRYLLEILCGVDIAVSVAKTAGSLAILFVCMLLGRLAARTYFCVWRYAGSRQYLKFVAVDAASMIAGSAVVFFVFGNAGLSLWQSISVGLMSSMISLSGRLLYQYIYRVSDDSRDVSADEDRADRIKVAIIGAGRVGCLLAEELTLNKSSNYMPICFVDTDATKIGSRVGGLPVYAEGPDVLNRLIKSGVQEVFIALPKLDGEKLRDTMDFYGRTGCRIKVYALPSDTVDSSESGRRVIRDIRIEDLLFRKSHEDECAQMGEFYRGKTVLITGGGGSIGGELCRQLVKRGVGRLVIFDIYENNAYDIQQELKTVHENADIRVEIGSVRDIKRLETVFAKYRPQIVFHAAAHKHVPLMEYSATEAVKNNVFGTLNTVLVSEKHGVEKFIMISTDKAVNPTSIMGATKRICEMIVQSRGRCGTVFSSVRFGNVLGSNGSVIPIFKRQIEAGGPVTITDKRIIRYFMTIPEAAQLVMTAGAMAKDGELFVLDMGKPIRILELAENMIRLYGYRPYEDIDIVEVGLRPGEKLYEELLMKNERLTKTENDMIFIEKDTPQDISTIEEKLSSLASAVDAAEESGDMSVVKAAVRAAVPTFCDAEEINACASDAQEMKDAMTV